MDTFIIFFLNDKVVPVEADGLCILIDILQNKENTTTFKKMSNKFTYIRNICYFNAFLFYTKFFSYDFPVLFFSQSITTPFDLNHIYLNTSLFTFQSYHSNPTTRKKIHTRTLSEKNDLSSLIL